jgi:hypothetical protein
MPRRFLFLDVNIEMQILTAIDAIGSPVVFEHVEGHQDTKYPDQPLSWEAQVNQRCDEIATGYLEAATSSIPTVTFLPASRVRISVGTHTITHHIPTQLRTFSGLPGIRATSPNGTNGNHPRSPTSSTGHYTMLPPYPTLFSNVCLCLSGSTLFFRSNINSTSSNKAQWHTAHPHAVAKTKT